MEQLHIRTFLNPEPNFYNQSFLALSSACIFLNLTALSDRDMTTTRTGKQQSDPSEYRPGKLQTFLFALDAISPQSGYYAFGLNLIVRSYFRLYPEPM